MKDTSDNYTQELNYYDALNGSLFNLFMKLKDSKIGHAEISILSVLANDMQLNRRNFAEIGQKDIAETLKIKQPNVSRSIKRLKAQGYISVEGNRYRFLFNG